MGRVSLQSERLTPLLTARALTLGVSGGKPSGGRPRRVGASAERDDSSAGRQLEVISWDRAGRLYSVWRDGRTSRRGLSGHVLQKWRDGGETHRAGLDGTAVDVLVAHAARRAAAALAQCRRDGRHGDAVAEALARASAFDPAAARADAERFRAIYSDVGILPPDQYLAVVVQATEGCSFRSCEFCDLFDRPYRVRTLVEFEQHVAAVRDYMGDSLRLRNRSVFLGAANALALPVSRLHALLDILRIELGQHIPVAGFIDAHTGAIKTADDYRELAEAGLHRVYVGVESGHDPLLAFVRKPSRADEAVATVRALKAAGVSVSVIVMLGLGGDRFAAAHAADTTTVLNQMGLEAGDLIYFSDLVVSPGGRYATLAASGGIRPLGADERRAQRERIREGLVFGASRPQLATYDIREFVY